MKTWERAKGPGFLPWLATLGTDWAASEHLRGDGVSRPGLCASFPHLRRLVNFLGQALRCVSVAELASDCGTGSLLRPCILFLCKSSGSKRKELYWPSPVTCFG